jgi:hypothetical protein
MTSNQVTGTGDGTRPTTSGGVANIGAGASVTGKKNALGETVEGPAPDERMTANRKDADAARRDDSAPLGLTEDLVPETNREPVKIKAR